MTSNPIQPGRRRWLDDIERAKGVMMIFVVLGHINDPAEPAWSALLRRAIYEFHMPVFMFLSGYTFVHVGGHLVRSSYGGYLRKRAARLLLPFCVMALLIITGKYVAQHLVSVNKPIGSYLTALGSVVFDTASSPVVSIWFVFVLFVYVIATPLLLRIPRMSFGWLLVLGLGLHAVWLYGWYAYGGMNDDFYLDRICWFYVFFVCGCLARENETRWLALVDRFWIPLVLVFAILDIVMLDTEFRYLVVGTIAMGAWHGLVRSRIVSGSTALIRLGHYAFAIYLLNTIFIGIVRGVLSRFGAPADHMAFYFVLALPVGLLGPILVREALARVAFTRPVARAMA